MGGASARKISRSRHFADFWFPHDNLRTFLPIVFKFGVLICVCLSEMPIVLGARASAVSAAAADLLTFGLAISFLHDNLSMLSPIIPKLGMLIRVSPSEKPIVCGLRPRAVSAAGANLPKF